MEFVVFIITNQSAVNRGIISRKQLDQIHNFMLNEFKKNGCTIEKIYVCPHKPDEDCLCRKPKPGMLINAINEYDVDIIKSWMIGDNLSDIHAADKSKLNSILIDKNTSLLDALLIIKSTHNSIS
jgi:D-glycero-D-manno-heptose 1,7-bisphosphate phosphatase